MASNYGEVRLVFDRYISDSLKACTRRKRTSAKEICYKILDSTNIPSISFKSLLLHFHTKQEGFPEVMKMDDHDPFTRYKVYSPDTDVFLLLTHFYLSLPQSLPFRTGKGKDARKINIGSSYEGIGPSMPKPCWGFMFLLAATRRAASLGSQKHFGGKNFKEQMRIQWMP